MTYYLLQALLAIITFSGLFVVASKSPINSVIFLVMVYLAGGCIFLLLDQYFLGLTLVIVYVGAIAILFLFTIFMVNVRLTVQKTTQTSSGILALLTLFLSSFLFYHSGSSHLHELHSHDWANLASQSSDLVMLGTMIFESYPLPLLLVGFLLLVVMVAIIKLHLDH